MMAADLGVTVIRKHLRGLFSGAVLIGLCFSVTACAGNDPDPTPSVHLVKSTVFEGTWRLPLEQVTVPDQELDSVMNVALGKAAAKCMAKRGFDMEVSTAPVAVPAPQSPYGLLDEDEARKVGYHVAGAGFGSSAAPQADPAPSPSPSSPDGFDEALNGSQSKMKDLKAPDGSVIAQYDPDSCSTIARDEVAPQWKQFAQVQAQLEAIATQVQKVAPQRAVIKAADKKWSSCMKKAGFTFDSPDDAYYSLWAADGPTQDEKDTAVADVKCKNSTGMLWDWSLELARMQQAGLDQQPKLLPEWTKLHNQILAEAKAAAK